MIAERAPVPVNKPPRRGGQVKSMSVQMEISPIFARYVDNNLNVELQGSTIGEALQDLKRQRQP